ncbi:MAG: hypothetical protein CHACPFDD_03056 [Phycisphaerae bacterium]|nr:hypothetical protein [Phycisphaerae bacterium]
MLVTLLMLFALETAMSKPHPDAGTALRALFDEHYAWEMREFPETAMSRGDYSNAHRLTDGSLAAIERRHGEMQRFQERLHAIDAAALGDAERLNYELFELKLKEAIEGHAFRTFLMAVAARWGPQQEYPQMHVRARFKDALDYENYLTRLELVPRDIDDTIEKLRRGVVEKRTPPKVTMKLVPDQFAKLAAGGLDALVEPFERLPESVSPVRRDELKRRFEGVSLPAVREALRRLGDYVTNEYIPACRESIAACEYPDGEAYYAYQLRTMTTTPLTAREIHEIGLREVARIRAEMMQVIRKTDFVRKFPGLGQAKGGSAETQQAAEDELFAAFLKYLRTEARFYCKTEDELLTTYRDICKRIDAELPKMFRVLPRLPYGVRKIPDFMAAHQTTAYYSQGDIRNAQPGYFYANTFALDQRPKYEMMALSLHEAVPGHHFQISLAQEMTDVPEFRKSEWFTAYGEGWALYAERLGIEMGLFEDPYDDFGRLLYEMWRACRLVVDPGMHALGWSRERAVQFMLDNTALSEVNINAEIDRYIAWPGQACAYKLGELKIRELRKRAEQALGPRFDVRAFHELLLSAGTLPLDVLERRVDAWLAAPPQSP